MHQLRCTISEDTKANLLHLAEILGINDPIGNLDLVIAKATELALRAKDPALRPEPKRAQPKATTPKATSLKRQESRAETATTAVSSHKKLSRYIAVGTKRQLFKRAGYRCEFVGPTGTRCPQKTHLQVDHIFPFRWGGSNSLDNLAILCGAHNRRKFERETLHHST